MNSRYEPETQAFGLEPRACSRYGWEFFLVSFGAFLLFQSLKEKLKSRFPEFFGKISSFEKI